MMDKMEILEKGMEFAHGIYAERQQKTSDGDPAGFAVVFNSRSQKFTTVALGSNKLSKLSKNAMHVYNVAGNGSCDSVI